MNTEFVGGGRRGGGGIPSGATLFSAYASLSATFTLLQQAFYQFVPPVVRDYMCRLLKQWFTRKPTPSKDLFQLIIEEGNGYSLNTVFEACQIYLCSKFSDSSNVLKVTRAPNEETMNFKLAERINYSETFEGISLQWNFTYVDSSSPGDDSHHYGYPYPPRTKQSSSSAKSHFSLIFDKEHKKKVCSSYLPYVVQTSKDVLREEKLLKLFDCNARFYGSMHGPGGSKYSSVNMTHPFTFANLAMDPESKNAIMEDLDRFLRRKEFYRRVGKPWKRGYLLYGPPGTGKSSLIAAMANYLKFDIYDLQLGRVDDSGLRQLLLCIPSQSIIVVEDIDCNRGVPKRSLTNPMRPGCVEPLEPQKPKYEPQMSLAALLNFADGLWSCCGDERLIVFTTNHKDRLDPALLRPGRMDMHIHMSYLTMEGFKVLAYTYLQVSANHQLFGVIKGLLESVNATPAEVAEELMRSEDVDIALQGVVELLNRKKSEAKDAANLKLLAEKNGVDSENTAPAEIEKSKHADSTSHANHHLFGPIKSLLEAVNATPAEVEELMRSEEVDIALQGVGELLKRKKTEAENAASLKLQAEKNCVDTDSSSDGEFIA